MNSELQALIRDFRDAQDRAIDYLHLVLHIPLPDSGPVWVRTGHRATLEAAKRTEHSSAKLNPHGFGIEVIHPDFRIDFDFGPNGEIDCFDLWRLALHRYHLQQAKPPVGPYNVIRSWLGDAFDKGELLTVSGSHNLIFQHPELLRSPKNIRKIG